MLEKHTADNCWGQSCNKQHRGQTWIPPAGSQGPGRHSHTSLLCVWAAGFSGADLSLMHMWVKLPEGLGPATGSLSPSPRCSCREQLEALYVAQSQKFTPAPGCWQLPLKRTTTPSATSKPLASSSLLASSVSEAVKRMQAEGSTCFQTGP